MLPPITTFVAIPTMKYAYRLLIVGQADVLSVIGQNQVGIETIYDDSIGSSR